jgi:hypothetical protein
MNPFLVFCDSTLDEDREIGANPNDEINLVTYDDKGNLISCLPDNWRPNLDMLE